MNARRTLHALVAGAIAMLVEGCAAPSSPRCAADESAAVADTLYFGTTTRDGGVTSDAWAGFVSTIVTPRFPQGLTTFDASGQWRTADGAILREATHVLVLVHPAGAVDERAVAEIVADYKVRFGQEAVLRVRSAACTAL